jgi:hypothetical protein
MGLTADFASHHHAVLAMHRLAAHTVLRHHLLLTGRPRIHLLVHSGMIRHLRHRISGRGENRYAGKAGLGTMTTQSTSFLNAPLSP